ncbi:MAG TPA: folate-binding protein [Opitutaceae bacterium]
MNNFPRSASAFSYRPACLLRVSGPDAATFLQGQFTNDLARAAPGHAVYGLWLDRRGRVLADSHVVRTADGSDFWVASVSSTAAIIARHLEDHIIADEVAIEDATSGWFGLALIGAGVGAWLAAAARGGISFPGRRDSGENWEWIFPEGERAAADAALSGATRISAEEVARMRIASGIPLIPQDIGPADLPNEGRLESAAISYSKGCYLGQEVMARLKSRGRVRRTLARAAGTGAPPALPAALWRADRKEGELRSAVPDAAGKGYLGIALVSVGDGTADGALALSQGGPPAVEISLIS